MALAYYNEIEPHAAQWLRNLIDAGRIAPGVVDDRSIEDIDPYELRHYTQCHFFAGIGVWSHALRLAGWPDDRPVWTGSCPCQPFSAAGKGAGFADERHLWPAFHHLIRECRPPVIFGEQVASRDGLEWLDLVQIDLEASGYATGAADLCAAGVGAPHIRQRLYWVADAGSERRNGIYTRLRRGRQQQDCVEIARGREVVRPGRFLSARELAQIPYAGRYVDPARGLADADDTGLEGRSAMRQRAGERAAGADGVAGWPGPTNGFWRDADWLCCRDGKWRPVEPGTFPLAHGASARVGRLRAYGNAIVPQVAAEFIKAFGV